MSENAPPSLTVSAGVALAAFALALALCPHAVGDGDAGEFTLMLAVAGVPHPPGYPLYVLGGHAWVSALRALGVHWAFAANAWSALGGALAVGLLHAVAARCVPVDVMPGRGARARVALVPAALLACHPVWLGQTTIAEVHGWHLAVVMALVLAAQGMLQALASDDARSTARLRRGALGFGVASGIGLAHHLTAVAFSLPLALVVGWEAARARRPWGGLAWRALVGLVPPLAAYLFVWVRARHPAIDQWPLLEPTTANVLEHVSGRIFAARYLGGFAPLPADRGALLGTIVPHLGLGLLALAASLAGPRATGRRGLVVALLVAVALQLAFVLRYRVPDPLAYFLPPLAVALIGYARGVAWAAERLPHRPLAAAVAVVVLATAALDLGAAREHARQLERIEVAIHDRWRAIPFERGIVMWSGDYHQRLRAYQILDGERPGLDVECPEMLTWGPPRRAFERRFGVDPLAGLQLTDDSQLPLIGMNIARRTGLPVLDFESFRP